QHDVLQAEGLTPPEDGWTNTDYVALGDALVRGGHTVWSPPRLNAMEPFIIGLGGRFADADHRVVGTMDSDQTVSAFVSYAEMMNAVSSAEQYMSESGYQRRALVVQRAASAFSNYGKYSVAPLPDAPDGKRYNNA